MRRPGSYYFITLLNKSENVQVTLLVRFVHKHSILTTSLYRNSNEKKEVHIIECYRRREE